MSMEKQPNSRLITVFVDRGDHRGGAGRRLPDTMGRHLARVGVLAALACAARGLVSPRAGSMRAGVREARSALRMAEDRSESAKRALRRELMSRETFYRGARPFEKEVHERVTGRMTDQFKGQLVQKMSESKQELVLGEGEKQVTFLLAKDYGFCWGVERSIELAWAAREAFPDKRMHLTNELIHNPQVNGLLEDMDVEFIEKTEQGKRFDAVEDGDVVILPAFGASLEEMELLDSKDVKVVDTTCPWVTKVWNTVDKHVRRDMTSVVHGKWAHEESIATASMAENYIIVKDIDEAAMVCKYILGEEGAMSREEFLEYFKNAISPGFDPDKHLKRIGLANQTTMYKKETTAISKLLEKTMITKFGPETAAESYAAFDTICDATQVRQDAIQVRVPAAPRPRARGRGGRGGSHARACFRGRVRGRAQEMCEDAKAGMPLDMILVVGGWDSSNTGHLLEIPVHEGLTAYHINAASCIKPDNSIEHRTVEGEIEVRAERAPPRARRRRPVCVTAVARATRDPDARRRRRPTSCRSTGLCVSASPRARPRRTPPSRTCSAP